jgi:hypothetical protein
MTVRVDRVSRGLMRRSIRLLDMEYKPSELAEELGTSKEKILRLVSAGAPARKDARGHYWIHGTTFVHWLEDAAPKKPGDKVIFADNECYCVSCRARVTYTESRRRNRIVTGTCPKGHKISRFLSYEAIRKGGAK